MMITRSIIPWKEWIYVKIYSNEIITNEILLFIFNKIIKKNQSKIDIFFFIRYRDPYNHLRIRLKIKETAYLISIYQDLSNVLNILHKRKYVWKIQFDTYEREIERYSYFGIESTELLFHRESIFICKTLWLLNKYELNNKNWEVAIWIINLYLTTLLNDNQVYNFLSLMTSAYNKEFDITTDAKYSIDNIYRKNKKNIDLIINNLREDEYWVKLYPNLECYKKKFKNSIKQMRFNVKEDQYLYLQSIIHMFCNRLFNFNARLEEMVIYNILIKYYLTNNYKQKK